MDGRMANRRCVCSGWVSIHALQSRLDMVRAMSHDFGTLLVFGSIWRWCSWTDAPTNWFQQQWHRGQTMLQQFYDAFDNGCRIISALKHHWWRFEWVAGQRKNKWKMCPTFIFHIQLHFVKQKSVFARTKILCLPGQNSSFFILWSSTFFFSVKWRHETRARPFSTCFHS